MARDIVYEEVPRLSRRVGDNLIAGQNNSTILLGRDRLTGVDSGHGSEKGAGALHLIVGRKGEDPSIEEDSATVYMSALTDPDIAAGTTNLAQHPSRIRRSGIVGRADCIRISARVDFRLSVGQAYFIIDGSGKVTVEGDVSLGEGAAERIIRGDSFQKLWLRHKHPTPTGLSGPPVDQMTDDYLSPRNKVR